MIVQDTECCSILHSLHFLCIHVNYEQTYKQRISNVHFAFVGFSLLYGAEDPSIAGMVLDSAFSNLYNLMMELVDVYKIRLPKFTVLSLSVCVSVRVSLCGCQVLPTPFIVKDLKIIALL